MSEGIYTGYTYKMFQEDVEKCVNDPRIFSMRFNNIDLLALIRDIDKKISAPCARCEANAKTPGGE